MTRREAKGATAGYATAVQFGFLPPAAANMGYLSTYVPPGFKKSSSLPAGVS